MGASHFRWTATDGMVDLDNRDRNLQSYAMGVSGDGSTIVGYTTINRNRNWTDYDFPTPSVFAPFRRDEIEQMQSLCLWPPAFRQMAL